MQRGTEVGSSGDGGFGEIRKITPCSRAPGTASEKPRNNPMQRRWQPRTRGFAEIRKITPCSGRGRANQKSAEQPQDLWTGRTAPASGATKSRATTGCAPGGERRTGVAGRREINPMQSDATVIFRLSPHKRVCARGPLGWRHPPRSPPNPPLAARAARPRGEGARLMCGTQTQLGAVFSFTLWRGSHGPSEGGHVYKVYATSRWAAPVPPRLRLKTGHARTLP